MELKDLLGPYTTVVDDFDIPVSSLDRSSKLKINKETSELKYTTEQTDLAGIYRRVHLSETEFSRSP